MMESTLLSKKEARLSYWLVFVNFLYSNTVLYSLFHFNKVSRKASVSLRFSLILKLKT